jgi:hypothetical protein
MYMVRASAASRKVASCSRKFLVLRCSVRPSRGLIVASSANGGAELGILTLPNVRDSRLRVFLTKFRANNSHQAVDGRMYRDRGHAVSTYWAFMCSQIGHTSIGNGPSYS